MNEIRRIVFTALVLAVLFSSALAAQSRARIWGIITDPDGAPLADVAVSVIDTQGGKERASTTTNKKGRYTVALLDATRPYLFHFEKDGFKTIEEEIKVSILSNERRDFTMPPGRGKVMPGGDAAVSSAGAASNAYNAGVADFANGDMEAAKQKFMAAIEKDPEFAAAYSALARVQFRAEDWTAARDTAKKAVELDDEDEVALSVLYQSYEQLGDEAEAKKIYDRLANMLEPAAAAFNVGAEAYKAGQIEAARAQFEKAIELDPELAAAHLAMAQVHAAAGEWAEAASSVERALDLGQDTDIAYQIRYDAYRALGDQAKAAQALEELKQKAPDKLARGYYEQGVKLFNNNDAAGAMQQFRQALELDPANARAHYMLALSAVSSGDTAIAKEHFNRFLELTPDDPDAATAQEMLKYLE